MEDFPYVPHRELHTNPTSTEMKIQDRGKTEMHLSESQKVNILDIRPVI